MIVFWGWYFLFLIHWLFNIFSLLIAWMDKETEVIPAKLSKVLHFHQEIPLSEEATTTPYKPHHTSNSSKSKKSKNKLDEFIYYRFGEDKSKIMKVLFRDENSYMIAGYYPFTEPKDDIEKTSALSSKNVFKVVKT